MKTQNDTILKALKKGTLTQGQAAYRYNVWRLAARICDLRYAGNEIETEWIQNGTKRFARYRLVQS